MATKHVHQTGVMSISINHTTSTTLSVSTLVPLATKELSISNYSDTTELISIALSPDGKTLLVLISDYGQKFTNQSSDRQTPPLKWVMVYDLSTGTLVQRQQISIPNSHDDLVWSKDGQHFFISGAIAEPTYVYDFHDDQIALKNATNQQRNLLEEKPVISGAIKASTRNSQHSRGGTLVSTNYNSVSMLRTMEDLQNIGYLGMTDIKAEPMLDAVNRSMKMTTHIALAVDSLCVKFKDFQQMSTCQNNNVRKVPTMLMLYEKNWSAQMTKNFTFEVENQLAGEQHNFPLYIELMRYKDVDRN
ncbi:YncE family protein [Nostoc sp. FACHB-280]|uniref:YncE family protein n=1 Tax=Nostoc sp. FACHB-280 TaxID=2692839 RepID=UPI00168B59EC|nr:hypothetical protein [Nostoc sp. FACHB-280]